MFHHHPERWLLRVLCPLLLPADVMMVLTGLAWWYERYAPGEAQLRDAQGTARAKGMGLWAELGTVPPWGWRRGIKQN